MQRPLYIIHSFIHLVTEHLLVRDLFSRHRNTEDMALGPNIFIMYKGWRILENLQGSRGFWSVKIQERDLQSREDRTGSRNSYLLRSSRERC